MAILISNIDVFNFEGAIRGMRNPLESHSKSDSKWNGNGQYVLGPNDLALAQRLAGAGHPSHGKFLRQIFVSMDILAPVYLWKEVDQHRVGVTTNSESTMHKLASTPITKECFSFDPGLELFDSDLKQYIDEEGGYLTFSETSIRNCENLRQLYLKTKDIRYWRALIQLLPSSWNQKRTWTANYEVLRNIYVSRQNHKLIEWREFCAMIETLPYAVELICGEKKKVDLIKQEAEKALGYNVKKERKNK